MVVKQVSAHSYRCPQAECCLKVYQYNCCCTVAEAWWHISGNLKQFIIWQMCFFFHIHIVQPTAAHLCLCREMNPRAEEKFHSFKNMAKLSLLWMCLAQLQTPSFFLFSAPSYFQYFLSLSSVSAVYSSYCPKHLSLIHLQLYLPVSSLGHCLTVATHQAFF